MIRDVAEMSNELEFSLYKTSARNVIELNGLPLAYEVNERDIVELNVSRAKTVDELNSTMQQSVQGLIKNVRAIGGSVYGGSSLLADVRDITPRWYRTTSLSQTCGRGFLDITSQQIVLGVRDESFGFELYNTLKNINPCLIALSASSPRYYDGGSLAPSGALSRRISRYESLCTRFPHAMWRDMPALSSLDEYWGYMRDISNQVKTKFERGELDVNYTELTRVRHDKDGNSSRYIDFDVLEPHQIYWFIRVRPDHRTLESGGQSSFSLELRVPDMPTTIERMRMINAFVLGISYYVADKGMFSTPPTTFEDYLTVARQGLNASIQETTVNTWIESLLSYAKEGLRGRNCTLAQRDLSLVEHVMEKGNDADLILSLQPERPAELRDYLINRLIRGESHCDLHS